MAAPRAVGGVHWADLDGLRALAILLVLARHSLRPFLSEDSYQAVAAVGRVDLTPLLLNGWMGVDLFFVLSGFLIGRQAWKGTGGLARFWFKRATRILPAYWTCLALIAVGLAARGAWTGAADDLFWHVVMLQDYTGSVFVPAFWSLGAEEKFYLLVPLFVVALRGAPTLRWRLSLLALLWLLPVVTRGLLAAASPMPVSYADYFPAYRSPFHLTFESLVVGFAIAVASLDQRTAAIGRVAREVLFWAGAATLVCWSATSLLLGGIGVATIVFTPALVGLAFGAMTLAAVAGSGSYSALLGWAGFRPVATGAYTLYLTHMMVTPLAVSLSVAYPVVDRTTTTGQWLAFLPWYLALSVASALVVHLLVERPVLRWRDRVLGRRAAVPMGTAVPA